MFFRFLEVSFLLIKSWPILLFVFAERKILSNRKRTIIIVAINFTLRKNIAWSHSFFLYARVTLTCCQLFISSLSCFLCSFKMFDSTVYSPFCFGCYSFCSLFFSVRARCLLREKHNKRKHSNGCIAKKTILSVLNSFVIKMNEETSFI